jgi:hypothetical protein
MFRAMAADCVELAFIGAAVFGFVLLVALMVGAI